MKRILGVVLVLAALQSCGGTYRDGYATTDVGIAVDIRNAPPPPPIRWERRPYLREVRGSSVYVVDDSQYDVFKYGGSYYCYSGGYWYRADSDRDAFVVIDARSVPNAVLQVPSRHWRHRPTSRHRHDNS